MDIGVTIDGLKNVITENKNILLGSAAGLVVGAGATAAIISATGSKSSSSSSKKRKSKKGNRDRIFKSKQKHEQRYKRKRKYKVYGKKGYINPKKKKSSKAKSSRRKGVHYTKHGQPYILLRSGKARFIKKRSKK
jgi:hypothetical protein